VDSRSHPPRWNAAAERMSLDDHRSDSIARPFASPFHEKNSAREDACGALELTRFPMGPMGTLEAAWCSYVSSCIGGPIPEDVAQ
jgi:hypothetical protein